MNPVTIPGIVGVAVVSVQPMDTAMLDRPATATVGPGRLLFERFMARLEHGDLEALLDLFTDDAEVLSFDGVRRGHAEVGRWLGEMLVEQGPGVLVSTDRFAEEGGVVRFEATITSPEGQVRQIYGVLVFVEGRIVRFLSGLMADLNGRV